MTYDVYVCSLPITMAKNGKRKSFAAFLKETRAGKKLNQKDFAKAAGISPACLNLLECEVRQSISIGTAIKIARASNVPVDEIIRMATAR